MLEGLQLSKFAVLDQPLATGYLPENKIIDVSAFKVELHCNKLPVKPTVYCASAHMNCTAILQPGATHIDRMTYEAEEITGNTPSPHGGIHLGKNARQLQEFPAFVRTPHKITKIGPIIVKKVFYYGVGNPFQPKSGMDVVLREHLYEIVEDACPPTFRLTAFDNALIPLEDDRFQHVKVFQSDNLKKTGKGSYALKRLTHLLRFRALMNLGFSSHACEQQFKRDLATGPDMIIVDHLQSLANIPLFRLLTTKAKLLYICHNLTPKTQLDGAKLAKSPAKKLFLVAQAFQLFIIEALLILKAAHVVFISSSDNERYSFLGKRKMTALCPTLEHKLHDGKTYNRFLNGDFSQHIIFVGGPDFAPNRFAIEWLVNSLLPVLKERHPNVTLGLIGKNTERYADGNSIVSFGFATDDELRFLLENCLSAVSPVIHGSGLKIKLLEAFSAGSAVFATKESLSGFDFMGVSANLDIDNPQALVELIGQLLSERKPASIRLHTRRAWDEHVQFRRGKLKKLIKTLVGNDALVDRNS
ncbi:glycosyltransferase family 4 protein [Rhizobium sp. K15/93]|nr:glycosyltransferase [Rhizobium sp. K15/93]MBO9099493.1 glycosyltransferase [Rhizobium sp. L58/93]QXZ87025.1 glycosyltransferase [Rhizobium sp. K1/93]QXZ92941.1 glycosyltransferase [Rhizobium sp. K15/93]